MKKLFTILACFLFASLAHAQLVELPIAPRYSQTQMVFNFVNLGGQAYYQASYAGHGEELCKTDGTIAGTVEVKDINPAGSTSGGSLANSVLHVFNGKMYFFANDGTHGYELWESDGTAGGTSMVKDIYTGSSSSIIQTGNTIRPNIAFTNQYMYFFARDSAAANRWGLWRSDGTSAGTVFLKTCQTTYYLMQADSNLLYFAADDGTVGEELYVTDGTPGGTVLVKDINPGSASSNPRWFTAMGGQVYFAATDGSNGVELYKTDGTASGTGMVTDINSYGNSSPTQLCAFNNKILFYASDSTHGTEPWVSDGTAGGTQMLNDITAGPASSGTLLPFTVKGVSAFFSAATQLWSTNGSPAGSVRHVANLQIAGVAFAVNDNRVYFIARGASGSYVIYSTSNGTDTLNHASIGNSFIALTTIYASPNALLVVIKSNSFGFSSLYALGYGQCTPQATITGNVPLTCNEHQITLGTNNTYDFYSWNTGGTANQLNVSQPGVYYVYVQDTALGCSSTDTVTVVISTTVAQPEICAVTVDSISGKNQVIWNKHNDRTGELLYRIERETATNIFTAIADIPFDSLSAYTDTGSNPLVTSHKYRLLLLDSCGNTSQPGTVHQTVHLSQNTGINGQVNLQWNVYSGTSYTLVNIQRSLNGSPFSTLSQLPGNSISYTDLTPPVGTLNYQIEVLIDSTCSPSRNNWSILSNRVTYVATGVTDLDHQHFSATPNPATDLIQLQFEGSTYITAIVITDLAGKVVMQCPLSTSKNTIDISTLEKGTYLISDLKSTFKPAKFIKL